MKPVHLRAHRLLHVPDDYHFPYSIHKRVDNNIRSFFIIRAMFMIRSQLKDYYANEP